jgi:hypothetical protein
MSIKKSDASKYSLRATGRSSMEASWPLKNLKVHFLFFGILHGRVPLKSCSDRFGITIASLRGGPEGAEGRAMGLAHHPHRHHNAAAFEAIAATFPLGSVGLSGTRADGERMIWLGRSSSTA